MMPKAKVSTIALFGVDVILLALSFPRRCVLLNTGARFRVGHPVSLTPFAACWALFWSWRPHAGCLDGQS
jgi:hypothetical protein